MATLKAINQDVLLEILAHSSPAATSSLALTARHFLKDARLALYRRVRILGHTKSRLFFRTMYGCSQFMFPGSPDLAHLVLVLQLLRPGPQHFGEYDEILQGVEIELALSNMCHLQTLNLELRVDFLMLQHAFGGELTEFAYDGPMEEELYQFFCLNPPITTLLLKHEFDPIPREHRMHYIEQGDFLPKISRLSIYYKDAITFLGRRPVTHLTLEYPELFTNFSIVFPALRLSQFHQTESITFFQATPAQWLDGPRLGRYLPELTTAVILQDGSWSNADDFSQLVAELVKALNFLPKLTTLVLLTRLGDELLIIHDALQEHSTLPHLRQFTFHNPLECVTFPDWHVRTSWISARSLLLQQIHLHLPNTIHFCLALLLQPLFFQLHMKELRPNGVFPSAWYQRTTLVVARIPVLDFWCQGKKAPPTGLDAPFFLVKFILCEGSKDNEFGSCGFSGHLEINSGCRTSASTITTICRFMADEPSAPAPPSQADETTLPGPPVHPQDTLPKELESLIPLPRAFRDLRLELRPGEDLAACTVRVRAGLQRLDKSATNTTGSDMSSSSMSKSASSAPSTVMWLLRKKRKLYFDPMDAHSACKKIKAKSITLVQSFDEAATLLDIDTDSD
ncbi:hypothetical protein C8J57DRAFT_1564878 [Mycena rebaudengoi]|nr:hypothetical protein C8J57DRAFT_1564878 [Mycena rebaudengoi]